jgi:hypothetical protein
MAWPLKGAIRPLTGYRGPGFAILVSLDEVDLGGSQCVDRDDAQLGHSAPRRDRRQANRQRLRQRDHALGRRV